MPPRTGSTSTATSCKRSVAHFTARELAFPPRWPGAGAAARAQGAARRRGAPRPKPRSRVLTPAASPRPRPPQSNPKSLETVINKLIELAEVRCRDAQAHADELLSGVENLDEESATPESIMLLTASLDSEKDRSDRSVLLPWIRFLWETYRTVLDLLKRNPQLQSQYHRTCLRAFEFCRQYKRKTEFRYLCNMSRRHMSELIGARESNEKRSTRQLLYWDSTVAANFFRTRLEQLRYAGPLEMWTEASRTVQDIESLLNEHLDELPDPTVLTTYYQLQAHVFWMNRHHAFHAFAVHQFRQLVEQSQPDLTAEQRRALVSKALVAALSVPTVPGTLDTQMFDFDIAQHRAQEIARFMDLDAEPTRASLLAEAADPASLALAHPALRALYEVVEVKFHPFELASRVRARGSCSVLARVLGREPCCQPPLPPPHLCPHPSFACREERIPALRRVMHLFKHTKICSEPM